MFHIARSLDIQTPVPNAADVVPHSEADDPQLHDPVEDEEVDTIEPIDQEADDAAADLAEDIAIISSGHIGLKTYLPKYSHQCLDQRFVKVEDAHGARVYILKSTLLWHLSSSDTRQSSDRTLRVQSGAAAKVGTSRTVCSNVQREFSIAVAQWCVFEVEQRRLAIAKVLGFKTLSGDKTSKFRHTEAPTVSSRNSRPNKEIGVLCAYFSLCDEGSLSRLPRYPSVLPMKR